MKREFNVTLIFIGIIGAVFFCIGLYVMKVTGGTPDSPGMVVGGICSGMGGFAVLVMICNLFSANKRSSKSEELKMNGKRLQGTIRDFSKDRTVKVDGRSPFLIYCTYTGVDDREYVFRSERLWSNPELNLNIGDPINIYVDRNDFQIYFVDVDGAVVQAASRRLAGNMHFM